MKRASLVRVLASGLLLGSVIFVGCKDKEEPASVPVPSGEPAATASAPTTTTTTEDPDAGAPAASTPAANPQPVATVTTRKGESIDACCTALRGVAKSGKTATAKSKAAAAAAVCPGIAKLVKDGTTSRSAGLAQIRSALTGFSVPPECQ